MNAQLTMMHEKVQEFTFILPFIVTQITQVLVVWDISTAYAKPFLLFLLKWSLFLQKGIQDLKERMYTNWQMDG